MRNGFWVTGRVMSALAIGLMTFSVANAEGVKTGKKDVKTVVEQNEVGAMSVVRNEVGTNVATAGARASVYSNLVDSGFFLPMQAATGIFTSDDMGLGNGFTAGGMLTGYRARVLNNGTVNGPVDVHIELFDGDPFAVIDTIGGFTNSLIAGSQADFLAIGGAGVVTTHELVASLAKFAVPRAKVWMNMSTTGCRLGWRISFVPATIGFSDDLFEFRENEDPAGTCCQNGLACIANTDCGSAARELCTDGVAESDFIFNFGGCGPANDNCANFYAEINAPAKTVIRLMPKENRGAAGTYVGSEVILTDPVAQNRVYLEVEIAGWSTTPNVGPERLKSLQATLDSTGLASGPGTQLEYATGAFGDACLADADCQNARFGLGGYGGGALCDLSFAVNTCQAGYQDTGDADWVYAGSGAINAADVSTPDYRYAVTHLSGPMPFWNGTQRVAGNLMLHVPAGARGTYTIGFKGAPDTVATDQNNADLPLVGALPGLVTIQVGRCCYNIGPATTECTDGILASECLLFAGPRAFAAGEVCAAGPDPAADCPSCQANADCADLDGCTVDTCDTATGVCSNTAVSVPAGSCCDSSTGNDVLGTGTVASSDDGNECTDDMCSLGGTSGVPQNVNFPDGTACSSNNDCLYGFNCNGSGVCEGLDPTTVPCVTDPDCASATGQSNFICKDLFCFCPVTPDLTFVKVNPPVNNCYDDGEKVTVKVVMGISGDPIVGGQVAISYDPACLDFISISPAGGAQGCEPASAFQLELFESVNEAAGTIFYAVGINIGGLGTSGPATLACISFAKKNDTCADCNLCFTNVNPRHTYLSSNEGQAVDVIPQCSKDINAGDDLDLNVPDDTKKNAACDSNTAIFSWSPASASASCGAVNLVCSGTYPNGAPIPAGVAQNGGEFPIGTSTLCCDATSVDCGNTIRDCWTVTVNDQTTLDLVIQLSPVMAGNGITRCIKFEAFSDTVQAPDVFERSILFGGLFDLIGHYTDTIKKPVGQFYCLSARDQQHTLRSCYVFGGGDCSGGVLHATFKGDPALGGNWLVGGNLDGWKKDNPNASHNVIDILDFGQFVSQYLVDYGTGNTPCPTSGPNADINGDGVANMLDFAFVSSNYLAESKDCCFAGDHLPASSGAALTEVSVRDLRTMGLGELAAADLNGDGMVNMEDMAIFMQGGQPTGTKPVRKGDLRSVGGTK